MDARIGLTASRQFNRISHRQLRELGMSEHSIAHRIRSGRLIVVHDGVYALGPILAGDDSGRWQAATLTAPGTYLTRESAAAALGWWKLRRPIETVVRRGSGGPRRIDRLRIYRSETLDGWCTKNRGVPTTTASRTLIDLAPRLSNRAMARCVREIVRIGPTSWIDLADAVRKHPGRRGTRRLLDTLARYSGLPIHRARSGAEVRALEAIRDDGRVVMPRLNVRIAGEEADLSWPNSRLIVEIDGGPFHLDRGEDLRKETIWRDAGWTVRRLSSDDVYERPGLLLALAPHN